MGGILTQVILLEASGSLTASYLIKAVQEAGYIALATDLTPECYAIGLTSHFASMPKVSNPDLWKEVDTVLKENNVSIVIPSLDETLVEWAKRKQYFKEKKVEVILSDEEVIKVFQDKWLTYNFFIEHNIPTPKTSLNQEYEMIKPRFGRGSSGIYISNKVEDMEGQISQEVLNGIEYTIDVFCDSSHEPVYIVPRERLNVKEGKSTAGLVVKHEKIEKYVREICSATKFLGPINIQCFEMKNGDVKFIEVNPRIAGGMALGFAATENWIPLMISNLIEGKRFEKVDIKYGLKMMRYYSEIFTY